MAPWIAAIASATLMGLGLACHRRVRAIFAEDPPSSIGRRRHQLPTPMAGMVPALLALFALAVIEPDGWLLAGVGLATAVGFLDDRGKADQHEMRWHRKGLGLLLACVCATVHFRLSYQLSLDQCALAFGFLFALTNAVNFMDNTDGVAASAGGIGLLLASGGDGAMAWAGMAYLGFLPFNWPRSLAFLGDTGSLCLGLCLATASLQFGLDQTGELLHHAALLPILVFAADFSQVVSARLILGVPPWEGDRRHLTHISMNLGLPRLLVAPLFAGLAWLGCAYFGG